MISLYVIIQPYLTNAYMHKAKQAYDEVVIIITIIIIIIISSIIIIIIIIMYL